ncbi:MAG: polysaccharide biosynthesis protein [Salinisphaera sp.]|nr:polysaccharide biosynthesis protein [Salinisphaera sp.]
MESSLGEMRDFLIGLPRRIKKALLLCGDLGAAMLAMLAALTLQGMAYPSALEPWWQLPLIALAVVAAAAGFGLYSAVTRYIAVRTSLGITQTAAAAACILYVAGLALPSPVLQPALLANFAIVLALLLAGVRVVARQILGVTSDADAQRLLIVGAGEAGVQLAQALNCDRRRRVVGFADDDPGLAGSTVADLPVHPTAALEQVVRAQTIEGVLLAIPSATRQRKQALIRLLEPLPVSVKTVPSLRDILSGAAQVSDIRDIEIEDLLGRDPVAPDAALLSPSVAGKTVLITGAGGSIGGELCRQIVALDPAHLVLLDASEIALYDINREIIQWATETGARVHITAILGNVLDRGLIGTSIRRFSVDTLYHAAAYKHVPLVEQNVGAAFRNNVIGTRNVAEAAVRNGVGRFILVSTDKAVRPCNIMGATKRVAEQVIQGLAVESTGNKGSGCIFSMVRFGNVLGSSGSVVPQFREQIRNGGPVTVTHPHITRYFMTIPEAAQLVIQAGGMATGGEVFVLDMGEPVRIVELARRMIRLAGATVREPANPKGEIEIIFTGLRPGEKLYEELLIASSSADTGHPMIGRAEEKFLAWPTLAPLIREMNLAAGRYQQGVVKQLLQQAVPEYTASEQNHDPICAAQEEIHAQTRPHSKVISLQ